MLQVLHMRHSPADDLAREFIHRVTRLVLVLLGLAIVAVGVAVAPLPGPGGIPVIVIGLMLVLRNSFRARRVFVRVQRAHPRMVFPIRRLLRREPEVFPVAWQQILRIERLLTPRRLARFRVARRMRLKLRRRAARPV